MSLGVSQSVMGCEGVRVLGFGGFLTEPGFRFRGKSPVVPAPLGSCKLSTPSS